MTLSEVWGLQLGKATPPALVTPLRFSAATQSGGNMWWWTSIRPDPNADVFSFDLHEKMAPVEAAMLKRLINFKKNLRLMETCMISTLSVIGFNTIY
jgi:hypothetical protein